MRGQYLTIEYVFFFAFGVTMAVATFLAFSGIADTIRGASVVAQLERTGEAIRGAIVAVAETANGTASTINYNASVPTRLSGCTYAIIVSGRNLSLNCTDNYKQGAMLDLYGLPVKDALLYSSRGYVVITANASQVVLG